MPGIEPFGPKSSVCAFGVHRQRGEIRQFQRVGIATMSVEASRDRMLNNIDGLCAERDRPKKEQPFPKEKCWAGVVICASLPNGATTTSTTPWIKALAEVRRLASREDWRYHYVQAIIVAIDQNAETVLGN
jgi:hypothetical protein